MLRFHRYGPLGVALTVATLASSCLKGPGFLQQGETEAATSFMETTEDAGDVTGIFTAAANRYQMILAAASSAIAGASVTFPPGSLSIDASIILGEGADAASSDVLAQLGLNSSSATGVGSSLYVATSANTDPVVPMSLSLPLPTSGGLTGLFLDQDTTKYAVAYVGLKMMTKETSVGLIPNKEITFKDGKATFETSTWGSYRLVKISEEVEKPVERLVKPTVETPPERNNEVKALPKMLVTARTPFVVLPVGKFTVTGENLIGMRAFIKGRKLTLKESSDGKSVEIQLPTTEDLIATTKTDTTKTDTTSGRGRGIFVIGLGQKGSSGTETNVMILDTKPTASAFSLNSEAICARQEFIAGDGTPRLGTGTMACTGRPSAEAACTSTVTVNCAVGSDYRAVAVANLIPKNIRVGITIGNKEGQFPSATYPLLGENPKAISDYPGFSSNTPVFDNSIDSSFQPVLFTGSGGRIGFDVLRVSANDELTPGNSAVSRSRDNTLFKPFKIIGSPQLVPANIAAGKTLFGTGGIWLTRSSWSTAGDDPIWTDSATGYTWKIGTTSADSSGVSCTAGRVALGMDLKWALQTGITSGPDGLLSSRLPISVWYQEPVVGGSPSNKTVTFNSASDVTLDSHATSAMVLCVTKPEGSRGNPL